MQAQAKSTTIFFCSRLFWNFLLSLFSYTIFICIAIICSNIQEFLKVTARVELVLNEITIFSRSPKNNFVWLNCLSTTALISHFFKRMQERFVLHGSQSIEDANNKGTILFTFSYDESVQVFCSSQYFSNVTIKLDSISGIEFILYFSSAYVGTWISYC